MDMTDAVEMAGNVALDAAGAGSLGPLWSSFFGSDDVFSSAQIQQLNDLFTQLQMQEYVTDYTGYYQAVNDYINNNNSVDLTYLATQVTVLSQNILGIGGVSAASIYLSTCALLLVILRIQYDLADDANKPGAAKNLADNALHFLSDFSNLETNFFNTYGWTEFIALKQSTNVTQQPLTIAAATSFGEDYVAQIRNLMLIVYKFAPDRLAEVSAPPYGIFSAPFDPRYCINTWYSNAPAYPTTDWPFIYKCIGLPDGVPSNFQPLSDLCWFYSGSGPSNPPNVLYIGPYNAALLQLSPPSAGINTPGFTFLSSDEGSGLPQDFSAWIASPQGIGIFTANSYSSQPDYPQLAVNTEQQYYSQVVSTDLCSLTYGGSYYSHPQFSDWGVFILGTGSYGYDGCPGVGYSASAFSGHPSLVVIDTSSVIGEFDYPSGNPGYPMGASSFIGNFGLNLGVEPATWSGPPGWFSQDEYARFWCVNGWVGTQQITISVRDALQSYAECILEIQVTLTSGGYTGMVRDVTAENELEVLSNKYRRS